MGNKVKMCNQIQEKQIMNDRKPDNENWKIFNDSLVSSNFKITFKRILDRKNQTHLIQAFENIKTLAGKQKFLSSIQNIDMDLLDSLYYNKRQSEGNQWKQITQKIIDIGQVIVKDNDYYEETKEHGFQLLRTGKVCFAVLAGGINFRFGNSIKEVTPIPTPSRHSIIQRIFYRLDALATLLSTNLTVLVVANIKKFDTIKDQLKKMDLKRVQVITLQQIQMGCLSEDGKIILDSQNQPMEWPVGNGDLWDILKSNWKNLVANSEKFEYLQIMGVSNSLEHCFDCFMLGDINRNGLHWGTKVVNSYSKIQPKIFIKNQQIYVQSQQHRYVMNNNRKIIRKIVILPSPITQQSLLNIFQVSQRVKIGMKKENIGQNMKTKINNVLFIIRTTLLKFLISHRTTVFFDMN